MEFWHLRSVAAQRRPRSPPRSVAGRRLASLALAIGLSTAVLAAIAALVWAPGLPHKLVTMRTTDNASGMDPQNVRDELARDGLPG